MVCIPSFGVIPKWKIPFQELPHIYMFIDGAQTMVKHHRCCALQDAMHVVMAKLAHWFEVLQQDGTKRWLDKVILEDGTQNGPDHLGDSSF